MSCGDYVYSICFTLHGQSVAKIVGNFYNACIIFSKAILIIFPVSQTCPHLVSACSHFFYIKLQVSRDLCSPASYFKMNISRTPCTIKQTWIASTRGIAAAITWKRSLSAIPQGRYRGESTELSTVRRFPKNGGCGDTKARISGESADF